MKKIHRGTDHYCLAAGGPGNTSRGGDPEDGHVHPDLLPAEEAVWPYGVDEIRRWKQLNEEHRKLVAAVTRGPTLPSERIQLWLFLPLLPRSLQSLPGRSTFHIFRQFLCR
jgi:hypothetical protein